MNNVLKEDLDFIIERSRESLERIRGKKIFITGGTGFFGKWLLETFIYANQIGYNIDVGVLSRNPNLFKKNHPKLGDGIVFYKGDIESFKFPIKTYEFIIHAATEASAKINDENPDYMLKNITRGTKRILEFAKSTNAIRILHTSSGAIYGAQPFKMDFIPENYLGAPDSTNPKSAYGEGKRISELMGSIFADQTGIDFINARCFAFVGPYLPLDSHFAIGNFIKNALKKEEILIKEDGSPRRSFLYGADLVIWLLKILTYGKNKEAYNVGSDQYVSIKELAYKIKELFPDLGIKLLKEPSPFPPHRYVPDISKARRELGLEVFHDLNLSILKTLKWHQEKSFTNI